MLKTRITTDQKYAYYKAARQRALLLQTIIGMCFANIVGLFWPSTYVFSPNFVIVAIAYFICLIMFKLVGR